jgi:ubiquitin carboxyl-terminal hydrolase 10
MSFFFLPAAVKDENDRGSVASDIMVPTAGRPAVPVRYTLNGVLYHHGTTASGGHYTVDVLHPNAHEGGGEDWLRIDDDVVSRVRREEVFVRYDNEGAGTDDPSRCAYLLLYHSAASMQT